MNLGPLNTLRFLLQHPLAKGRRIATLQRYLRWQLGSRISPGAIAVDYVNDARLLVRPGMTGATGNIYVGLHEYEDMAFLLHALRATDRFADIGANVGTYAVLAGKVVGARVIAFEPVAPTFRGLMDNIALNAIAGLVDARQVCVGNASGEVLMTTDRDTTNHVVPATALSDDTSARVSMVRLDDALHGDVPFLIKLDVEGYELEVIQGAAQTLADPALQCIIMEVNRSGQRYGRSDMELVAEVERHGFARYSYSVAERRLVSPEVSGANAIYVRDRSLVQHRLTAAPHFNVCGLSL